jgi:hypothetical protein
MARMDPVELAKARKRKQTKESKENSRAFAVARRGIREVARKRGRK